MSLSYISNFDLSQCELFAARLAQFAERIRMSKSPALVYGQEIERSGGWNQGTKFAEQLRASVFLAPLAKRASFPQTHPQFQGMLPMAIGSLSKRLKGHDLVIVIGAPISATAQKPGNLVSANCLTEIRMKRIEDHLEGHSEGFSRAATTGVLSLRDTFVRSTSNVFTHRLSGQSLVR